MSVNSVLFTLIGIISLKCCPGIYHVISPCPDTQPFDQTVCKQRRDCSCDTKDVRLELTTLAYYIAYTYTMRVRAQTTHTTTRCVRSTGIT